MSGCSFGIPTLEDAEVCQEIKHNFIVHEKVVTQFMNGKQETLCI